MEFIILIAHRLLTLSVAIFTSLSILFTPVDDMLSRQSGSSLVIVATVLPLLQTLSSQQSSVTMDTKLLVSNQRKASQMIYKISKLDIVADCKHESKDQVSLDKKIFISTFVFKM